jgi:hypothetical protein
VWLVSREHTGYRVIVSCSGGINMARTSDRCRVDRRTFRRRFALRSVFAVICLVGLADRASASSAEIQQAEDLVLAVYFEGMPTEHARELTPAGAQHLIELLQAGEQIPFHSNIVLALGIAGHPRAFETLEWYGRDEPGEVASGIYRARVAVPIAMGHLAARDDRALLWLSSRARGGAKPPRWKRTSEPSSGLTDTMRVQVLNALAISGRSAAADVLNEIARGGSDANAGAALQLFSELHTTAQPGPEVPQ